MPKIEAPPLAFTDELPEELGCALKMLRQAYFYSKECGLSPWDFAIEIHVLYGVGLRSHDLRWMVCKGLVEHAEEVADASKGTRTFRSSGKLSFTDGTCFILSEPGVAGMWNGQDGAPGESERLALTNGHISTDSSCRLALTPCWDWDRQELRLGERLVKRYKVPSPNQETILAAFEEESWPHRIDDPLPPKPDQEPKRRLHDTINSLNRNQKARLIRFLGDGSGLGVRWELSAPE